MISAKKYIKVKQILEFIFSDIAEILNVRFNEVAFKNIERKDIDYCLNYYSNHSGRNTKIETLIDHLNETYFLILGASKDVVLKCFIETDKFKDYKV